MKYIKTCEKFKKKLKKYIIINTSEDNFNIIKSYCIAKVIEQNTQIIITKIYTFSFEKLRKISSRREPILTKYYNNILYQTDSLDDAREKILIIGNANKYNL